jgi:hypothetical protein
MREAEKDHCSASSLTAPGLSSVLVAGENHSEDEYLSSLNVFLSCERAVHGK